MGFGLGGIRSLGTIFLLFNIISNLLAYGLASNKYQRAEEWAKPRATCNGENCVYWNGGSTIVGNFTVQHFNDGSFITTGGRDIRDVAVEEMKEIRRDIIIFVVMLILLNFGLIIKFFQTKQNQ